MGRFFKKSFVDLFIFLSTLLFALFLLPKTNQALATDYYVATTGNDSNPGTSSQPWRTIQKAANTMVAGDTVYVRGGIYDGDVNLVNSGTVDKYITFAAYPGEDPVLDGAGKRRNGFTDRYSSSPVGSFVIDGFEIKNYLIGIELERSSNFVLENNTIHDVSHFGISSNGGNKGEIANNTVYNVGDYSSGYTGINHERVTYYKIHHNVVSACHHNGIMISYESDYNLIYDNIVFGNNCGDNRQMAGIAIEVDSEHNRVDNNLIFENCNAGYLSNSPNNEIYHNTIFGNQAQVSFGDWLGSVPTGNIIKNNIFVVTPSQNNAIAFWKDSTNYDPLQNTLDYNLYYNVDGPDKSDMIWTFSGRYSFSQWQGIGKEEHGVLGNPQFVDSGSKDFHLLASSPAIDTGIDVGITDDFEGNSRPQGAGYDIGAYEYVSGGASPIPTPTPPPSFSLSSDWNEIVWPDVSGIKASDVPPECPMAVAKENSWFKPYVKNYGGVNFGFESGKSYYLKCNQETIWQL